MRSITVCILASFLCLGAIAQKQPKIFKPFYFNFGLNMPTGNYGTAPLITGNAKQNILDGYYGGKKLGYLFEFGTKIYFNSSDHKFRYGLDWTFLSLNYNELNWDDYAAAKKGATVNNQQIFSAATKLGPVISYNIIEKLVVDAHFQVAPVVHYSNFEYHRTTTTDAEDFNFNDDTVSDLYGGIKTGTGIGIRWGVIGLAADYFSGKLKTTYQYENTATGETANIYYREKIKTSTIQLKLTLNL